MKKITTLSVILTFVFFSCSEETSKVKEETQIKETEYAIIYNVLADTNDNYEVFSMNMDGSEKKNISNLKGVEWSYYSFMDKVYFISDKDTCQRCAYYLYKTNFKGENPKKVSNIPLADSWMSSRKDGLEFIVKPNSKIDSAFYIIDLKGTLIQRLETGFPSSSDPVFIDNGNKVVFRGGTKKSKREEGYKEELYSIDVDGNNLTQLTHYPESDTTAPWYAYKVGPAKLHPTENFISYPSFQNGKYSLFAVTTDGKKQWKLTSNNQNEVYHNWSPDGKWLVTDISDTSESHYDIALIDWKTKEMKILTDTSYKYQQSPNFVIKSKK